MAAIAGRAGARLANSTTFEYSRPDKQIDVDFASSWNGEGMFDLNPLTAISSEIRAWLTTLDHRKELRNQSIQRALESLSTAVLKTRAYVSAKKRDRTTELEISELWNQAHLALGTIDRDLAERCFSKADLWVDPASWSDEKIQRYNIQLESMSDAVRNFQAS